MRPTFAMEQRNSPVNRFVVALGGHDFGSQIIRRTAQCPSNVWNFLGESKVRDLEMAVTVQEEILGLQISVNDVLAVQVVERQCDFGGVELRDGVRESLFEEGKLRESRNQRGCILLREHTCDFRRRLNSSPPSTKSMTMYRFLESWNVPHNVMRNGCLTCCNMRRSSLVCSTCFILTT